MDDRTTCGGGVVEQGWPYGGGIGSQSWLLCVVAVPRNRGCFAPVLAAVWWRISGGLVVDGVGFDGG